MNVIKNIYYYLVTLLFLFPLILPTSAFADSVYWYDQSSPVQLKNVFTISTTTVTAVGSSNSLILCKGNKDISVNWTNTYLQHDTSGPRSFTTSDFEANTAYIAIKDPDTINFDSSSCDAQVGNINAFYYPLTIAGQNGFVYFETDSNKNIVCYDSQLGPLSTGKYKFQECKNDLVFPELITEATTTINVDLTGVQTSIASSSERQVASNSIIAFMLGFLSIVLFIGIIRKNV